MSPFSCRLAIHFRHGILDSKCFVYRTQLSQPYLDEHYVDVSPDQVVYEEVAKANMGIPCDHTHPSALEQSQCQTYYSIDGSTMSGRSEDVREKAF